MVENSRWKTIQSYEHLERFLRSNPSLRVYDTRDRESRYVIRQSADNGMLVATVDGRSFNALITRMERVADGGWKLRKAAVTP
jgi:hypothetical protein